MSGTYPSYPYPSHVVLRSTSPTMVSLGHSLQRQARSRQVQRWAFELDYPPLPWSTLAPLVAFLSEQQGRYGSFSFALWKEYIRDAPGSEGQINGAGQSGTFIVTDAWAPGAVAVQAGEFIQFGTDPKVYLATATATADGTGNATLTLNTPVVTAPTNNDVVHIHTKAGLVAFQCALAEDSYRLTTAYGSRYLLSISLEEVL